MSNSYVANRLRLLKAPLAGPNARAFTTAIGGAQDDAAVKLIVSGTCRSATKAPNDALDLVLGATYARPRSPRETGNDDAYRARLGAAAWTFWEEAQRALGIVRIFDPYGSTTGQVLGNGPPVAAPMGGSWWSEFVFVWPSTLAPDDAWDAADQAAAPPLWDDGGLWDIEFTPTQPTTAPSFGVADLDYLRREIRNAKGAGAYPVLLAAELTGSTYGGAAWDDGTTWDAAAGVGGELWDTLDAPLVLLPLGRTWEDEALIYGGAPDPWDTPGGIWDGDSDGFVPPSGGW